MTTATISRKETIAALEPLKSAIAARSAIQELSYVWFDGDYIYATNGGMGVRVKFKSPIKCGIPGSLFLGLLNQAAADTLDFSFDDDIMKLKAGRANLKLNTLPVDRRVWRYPEKSAGKPLASFKVSEVFIKALKRVLALKVSSPKRMEHHAVCIYAEKQEMDLYVTDSVSLLVAPVPEPMTGTAKKIALPREMAEQIAAQCKPGQELKMYADHFIVQATDKVILYSNVFDTSEMLDLPGYADQYTNDRAAPPFALPDGFNAGLERAVLLAGSEEPKITLTAKGKSLKLSGQFRFGKLDEDFTLSTAAPPARIVLGARMLLSVKGVDKLALSNDFANMRADDGFMYIVGSTATAASEEPEGDAAEAQEEGASEEEVVEPKTRKRKKGSRTAREEVPFDA